MLAIGRILRTGARLLLLDEPTEGLAPVIIQQIGRTIRMLKQQGFTILLVEQNFRFAATVADRYYVDGTRPDHRQVRQCRTRRQYRTSCTTISEFEHSTEQAALARSKEERSTMKVAAAA